MPRILTQYRVFIGSPSGLDAEREQFWRKLQKFSQLHAENKGAIFQPVGWEATIGGVGRPQEMINQDLRQCDFAVFVLHDRWGSSTGAYSSGVEEEWKIAEELYDNKQVRNIALLFKKISPEKMADPGPQLSKVIEFKKSIENSKRYLFDAYESIEQFLDYLEGHLASWLKNHDPAPPSLSVAGDAPETAPKSLRPSSPLITAGPSFDFWIAEAEKLAIAKNPDHSGALYCAAQATAAATNELDWARATFAEGGAKFGANLSGEALATLNKISNRFKNEEGDSQRLYWARSLLFQGYILGTLGRRQEEIAIYDDVVTRLGAATSSPLPELVALALVSKGFALGELIRYQEALESLDEVVTRYGAATDLTLQGRVALALISKGVALGELERNQEAIDTYDEVLARFDTASELFLREAIAQAFIGKGAALSALARTQEAIAAFDEVLARFGAVTEESLRDIAAKAKDAKNRLQQG